MTAIASTSHRRLSRWLLAVTLTLAGAPAVQAQAPVQDDEICRAGDVLPARPKTDLRSVKVTGICFVEINKASFYKDISILDGGELRFIEARAGAYDTQTDFWANSIIIENGGSLVVNGGVAGQNTVVPYGYLGGSVTIHLYGKNESKWNAGTQKFDAQNKGSVCKSDATNRQGEPLGPCGIPKATWDDNGKSPVQLPGVDAQQRPIVDYFYQYGPLRGDADCTPNPGTKQCDVGYFGNKVLGVSYGATLDLYGYKGITQDTGEQGPDRDPLSSGRSWRRLVDGQSAGVGSTSLWVDRDLSLPNLQWRGGDEIVVTTTDYLPGHSEKLRITSIDYNLDPGIRVNFQAVDNPPGKTGLQWPHNGTRYGGPKDTSGPASAPTKNQWVNRLENRIKDSIDPTLRDSGAETRAAVALLTRSIQIVSAGDNAGDDFPTVEADNTKASYSFGAHMIIRQGFKSVNIKGVEFRQMGQGGRLGHYPVHFHMARKTPDNTYVKDSSINESMTRWIVLHSTQGVTLARNVGYKSIGHGFYLEDGTETDNKFYSNIGIYARAALATTDPQSKTQRANPQNPRMVPGILADNQNPNDAKFAPPNVANPGFPYRSDNEYPTVFWITNGWNDFIGNMAAGAGACGAAYWLVPASNMNMVDVPSPDNKGQMIWSGYAELQGRPGFGGATPLKSFYRNSATSTMHSFQTTDDAPPCDGVIAADARIPDNFRVMQAIRSDAPFPARHDVTDPDGKTINVPDNANDHFYPHVIGGARMATACPASGDGYDCSPAAVTGKCATSVDPTKDPMRRCAVTVLDHFTSSFHWAHGNVSAIWLRPQWYLVTNSVISDVQNGGLSFVTGGDYTHASIINGYWGLARNTVFIGNTNNNADSTKNNPYAANTGPFNAATGLGCDLIKDMGAPVYCLNSEAGISIPASGFFTNQRLSNIYDGPSYQDSNAYLDITTADCPFRLDGSCIYGKGPAFLLLRKVPGVQDANACYLPNAAIGWKQPNGFFYPPAFHSRNLFFDNVDLRHYVIAPLFKPNSYLTDADEAKNQYCNAPPTMFDNWTAIDRQTELNDDDGTLTGLSNSLSDGHLKQTISINEDPFFSAPIEAAECGSALGSNADAATACSKPQVNKPPVTARTSPYDYVATVIYHKSANQETDPWGIDCANERCYGVPLFRQYLTDTTDGKDRTKATKEMKAWYDANCDKQTAGGTPNAACRWPFIRMAGASIGQRNTLTINNGVYYIDTTVSAATQKAEKYASNPAVALNVFTPGQKYHVFFIYAKQTTVQRYQIYVGKNFSLATQFEVTNVDIEDKNFKFLPKVTKVNWARPSYDAATGILSVDINFQGLASLDPTPANGLCAPRTFCQPVTDPNDRTKQICVSNLNKDDRLFAESDAVCRNWAVKDLDCPPLVKDTAGNWISGGCPGFSFTMPSAPDFAADDKYHRPQPTSFPLAGDKDQGQPDWGTRFLRSTLAPDSTKGRCYYPDPLPDRSCPKP